MSVSDDCSNCAESQLDGVDTNCLYTRRIKISRVSLSVVSHFHQYSRVAESGPRRLRPDGRDCFRLGGWGRAPRGPALGAHTRHDGRPGAMIADVQLDARAHHCAGNQREENDLEWNENDRAFSSRGKREEADQFPSSDEGRCGAKRGSMLLTCQRICELARPVSVQIAQFKVESRNVDCAWHSMDFVTFLWHDHMNVGYFCGCTTGGRNVS
jgi:hypothetical protein